MNDSKKNINEFIITIVLLLVLSIGLLFITAYARTQWKTGLAKTVRTVLVPFEKEYEVLDFIPEKTPFAVSSAVFKLRKKGYPNDACYAVIIKSTAMYGAMPLVYIFDGDEYIFAGKVYDFSSEIKLPQPILDFWAKRARLLLPVQKGGN